MCPPTIRGWQQVVAGEASLIFVPARPHRTSREHAGHDHCAETQGVAQSSTGILGDHHASFQ
jgi:hypothetical protein